MKKVNKILKERMLKISFKERYIKLYRRYYDFLSETVFIEYYLLDKIKHIMYERNLFHDNIYKVYFWKNFKRFADHVGIIKLPKL